MSKDTAVDDAKLKLLIEELVTSAISQQTISKLDKKLVVELKNQITSFKLAYQSLQEEHQIKCENFKQASG